MGTRKLLTLGTLVLAAGVLLGFQIGSVFFDGDISKALKRVEDAFVLINQRYVEDIDADGLAEEAIAGMMGQLDPHSTYINARNMRRENERFNASFEGIGISYVLLPGPEGQDTLSVVTVIPGGPSEKVGLYSGDRIVAVDDSTAIGYTDDDVQGNLKGPRGSTVAVTVRRPGEDALLDFEITRDRVPIVTLDASYLVDEETGYVRINRFARTTHTEFRQALSTLRAQGARRLVLDLRGNPGGYMNMAVRVSDEFLAKGQVIVSQRGRGPNTNETFRSSDGGVWEDLPVIVLVDARSASASEIVSGALQDHDRGLIVGRRTFGKGLVQNQFVLNDGSALRVTVARYFTPSGRLIQTAYEDGDRSSYLEYKRDVFDRERTMTLEDILSEVPDSLKYQTDGGRTVVAGGGILPDIIVPPDSLPPYLRAVLSSGLENDWVRDYLDREGAELRANFTEGAADFVERFDINAATLQDFRTFAEEEGVAVGEAPADSSADAIRYFSESEFEESKEELSAVLEGRIARRLYDAAAWYRAYQPVDETFQATFDLWSRASELALAYESAR